jgi:hypothetical protein
MRSRTAYCGLADCYSLSAFLGMEAPDAVLPKARDAARTALMLDDELAEAHASLSSITKIYEWDWRGAETGYQRALALHPIASRSEASFLFRQIGQPAHSRPTAAASLRVESLTCRPGMRRPRGGR